MLVVTRPEQTRPDPEQMAEAVDKMKASALADLRSLQRGPGYSSMYSLLEKAINEMASDLHDFIEENEILRTKDCGCVPALRRGVARMEWEMGEKPPTSEQRNILNFQIEGIKLAIAGLILKRGTEPEAELLEHVLSDVASILRAAGHPVQATIVREVTEIDGAKTEITIKLQPKEKP